MFNRLPQRLRRSAKAASDDVRGNLLQLNQMQAMELNQPADAKKRRGLLEVSSEELTAWLAAHQEPSLRARQLRRWLVAGRAESFECMTDLPRNLRHALAADFEP